MSAPLCLNCGAVVEFYEFTSLCNACEDANLRAAHPCPPPIRFPGPLDPQWEAVVNTLSFGWVCLEEEIWERHCHELDMIRNAMCDNTFDGLVFNRPPRYTEEH